MNSNDYTISDRRSKVACIRCKSRKTKCSGQLPCSTCISTKSECLYPRKPKRIKIYDTDLEALQERVFQLQHELDNIKKVKPFAKPQDWKLSVLLRSPSCELIAWNLINFMTNSNEDLTISPDFNSSLEENIYDSILFGNHLKGPNPNEIITLLLSLSLSDVESFMSMTAKFLNAGYLTVNPIEFKNQLKVYYSESGQFIYDKVNTVDYFLLKVLMVVAMGNIYSEDNCLGLGLPRVKLPGLKYFQVVVQNLPSNFEMLNFNRRNIKNILELIELFGIVSLYCRILDKKSASCFFTSTALQLCIFINLHKESMISKSIGKGLDLLPNHNPRSIFWSTYCVNRFSCTRIGQPIFLSFKEISLKLDYDDLIWTNDLFGDTKIFMKYYIELAKISELINFEVYNNKYNPKDYLDTIFNILSLLKDWSSNLPDSLKIEGNLNLPSQHLRTLSSLHFNHLHHVYLTCIPIMLHLTKLKILNFTTTGQVKILDLNTLPKNIQNLINYFKHSSEKTTNIFHKLYENKGIRAFGFTEIDYLFSTILSLLICLILNFDPIVDKNQFKYQENFQFLYKVISEMSDMGNLIAKAKLLQIDRVVETLDPLLVFIGCNLTFSELTPVLNPSQYFESLSEINYTQEAEELFKLSNEDLNFMDAILNEYDSILN